MQIGQNASSNEVFDTVRLLPARDALAKGDFSVRLPLEWTGGAGKVADTFNRVAILNQRMVNELERVGRVVGKEGKLSQRANMGDVSGDRQDAILSVNTLVDDLVRPTSETARVICAVAQGDLSQTRALEVDDRLLEGEFLRTARLVNKRVDQPGTFASEVTRVAREVGTDGKLGGQAQVQGVSGTWKDLTDSVNFMAGNLTSRVRGIAKVVTFVANGDLKRKLVLEAKGEIAEIKDNLNEMIRNLRETTQKNTEQDWLKTNLAKFSRMLQGQRDLTTVGRRGSTVESTLALGEGLVGQCAIEKQKIAITKAPPDYIRISSALGNASPQSIIVLPVLFEGQVKGALEMASLDRFNSTHLAFLEQLCESIGIVINTIEANMRTEDLLKQSQSLAQELPARGEELEKTNEELQEKAPSLRAPRGPARPPSQGTRTGTSRSAPAASPRRWR